MKRKIIGVVLASGLAWATVGLTSPAHAATVHNTGTLIPAKSGRALPLHGSTVSSLNWSGYAVTGSGIHAVTGTFVVPTAGLLPPGFAATWAGIGGYNTKDLIQAGVSEDSLPSNPLLGPQYYAWYELLPATETQLTGCTGDSTCAVSPGNQVTVAISQVSGSNWSISVTDAGHWSWSKTVSYASSESSAEWILEAPTLLVLQTLLAPVGTVHFGPTSNYTDGSGTHTIGQGNPVTIDLGLGIINEATPSALASTPAAVAGQSFNDCAYAQSCPAP